MATTSIPVMSWVRDAQGRCEHVSPSFCQFVGRPASEMLGEGWLACVHPADRPALLAREAERSTDAGSAIEYRLRSDNGDYRWVLDVGAGANEHGSESLVGLCTEGLSAATVTDELIGMIAHDLRSPLRVLEGLADVAIGGSASPDPREMADSLRQIRDRSRRLMGLLNDMLELGRVAHCTPHVCRLDLANLVRSAYEEAHYSRPDNDAELELQVSGSCDADPSLLRQVLVNLLSNSLKFTAKMPGPSIRVRSQRSADALTLVVEDNGTGFPPDEAALMFLPFRRLHARGDYEGHGMGLAIVRRIIECHGGQVWAEALPDRGARFSVRLPQAA